MGCCEWDSPVASSPAKARAAAARRRRQMRAAAAAQGAERLRRWAWRRLYALFAHRALRRPRAPRGDGRAAADRDRLRAERNQLRRELGDEREELDEAERWGAEGQLAAEIRGLFADLRSDQREASAASHLRDLRDLVAERQRSLDRADDELADLR
eukprot:gene26005-61529_t